MHKSITIKLLIVMLASGPLLYGSSNSAFASSSTKSISGDTQFWAFSCSTATSNYAASSAAASSQGGFSFSVTPVHGSNIAGTWSIAFSDGSPLVSGTITGGKVSGSSFTFTGIETANSNPVACGSPPIQITLSGQCGDNTVFKLAASTTQSVQTAAGTGTVLCQ